MNNLASMKNCPGGGKVTLIGCRGMLPSARTVNTRKLLSC